MVCNMIDGADCLSNRLSFNVLNGLSGNYEFDLWYDIHAWDVNCFFPVLLKTDDYFSLCYRV